jgi:hypothetical protein
MITADATTLMRQAHYTAKLYMQEAITDIDELLGKGYAKAHPELIAAYMQTAARDLHTAISAQALEGAIDGLAQALYSVKEALYHIDISDVNVHLYKEN